MTNTEFHWVPENSWWLTDHFSTPDGIKSTSGSTFAGGTLSQVLFPTEILQSTHEEQIF